MKMSRSVFCLFFARPLHCKESWGRGFKTLNSLLLGSSAARRALQHTAESVRKMSQSAYDFSVKDAKGGAVKLKDVAGGKVSLFVNVASQCGFTPQYKGLQSVQDKYSQQGFSVLAFPCNEFGGQEPGSASDVSEKMCERFKTTFPIYDKVRVKGFGDECEPVWKYLKENSPVLLSKEIWWNFEKVLVDRQGKVIRRYASTTSPESISGDIEKALGA